MASPHRKQSIHNAAFCCRRSVVCVECLCKCLLVTTTGKTAELLSGSRQRLMCGTWVEPCIYIYIRPCGVQTQTPRKGHYWGTCTLAFSDVKTVDKLNVLSVFCKAAAVIRPLATSIVATCHNYVLISLNVHFEQTVYDLRMTAA